jgi:hypothetical protein
MKRALLVFALCASFAAPAAAQRAALDVDSLAPAGLRLIDVRVRDQESIPVRLSFAQSGSRAEISIDVSLERDAASARHSLRRLVDTTQGELPAVDGIGETALGGTALLAFVRENVFVIVRAIAPDRDALEIARHLDAAILRAPRGTPRASTRIQIPDVQEGTTRPIETSEDVLALHAYASGDVNVRNTRGGWVVSRVGSGEARISVVVVDRSLRRSSFVRDLPRAR